MDNQNLVAIVDRSETRLRNAGYTHCGVSVELYQFSRDTTKPWNGGHIFRGNRMEDLSFQEHIAAVDANNKRDAAFFVHEASKLRDVEAMVKRRSNIKDVGILNLYVGGYNTQISKPVSGFHVPNCTFAEWLALAAQEFAAKELAAKELADQGLAAQEPPSTTIPVVVKQLLRTGYQGIETMLAGGSTSDVLDDPHSYLMVENRIKIDPLRIRDRNPGEGNMQVRKAFGRMIEKYIYPTWRDDELLDFIVLLRLPKAGLDAILGAPVLRPPHERELMYPKLEKATLPQKNWNWLADEAQLGGEWKIAASNEDLALKQIIDHQAKPKEKLGDNKPGVGFSPNLSGALRFASVVTAHYHQHVKGMAQALQDGVGIKNRVDWVLKKVLPRLLTRRYNADYI